MREPGVTIAPRVANEAMPEVLRGARVWLAPGHASETFCLAAAEAVAAGVPVITLGRGALKERVRHGVDGFICADMAEMGARILAVLTDDDLWWRLHRAGLETRANTDWGTVARAWQALPA
jgi:glycosyltransferase involved in cell wall biosynthesis